MHSLIKFNNKVLSLFFIASLIISSHPHDAKAQVKVDRVIPMAGTNIEPSHIRIDPEGKMWIYNSKIGAIQRLNEMGIPDISIFGGKGKNLIFKKVNDFQFTKDGLIAVVDTATNRMVILKSISPETPWQEVQIDVQFPVPSAAGLALSHDDIIAVGSLKEKAIKIFSLDGVALYSLAPPKEQPIKSINGLSYAHDGTIWVLDGKSGVVHRFGSNRKWLGLTSGLKGGVSIDVDEYGFGYVLSDEGKWHEINQAGKISQTFGTKGKQPGKMKNPTTLALQNNNSLWVADTGNKRLQLFELASVDKHIKLDTQPSARIQIRNGKTFNLSLNHAIYDSKGNILFLHNKKNQFEWFDDAGKSKSAFMRNGKKDKGFSEPVFMAKNSKDEIWVCDMGDHSIKQISPEGEILKLRGEKGRGEGHIKNPSSFFVKDDGSMLVVDKKGDRLQAISSNDLFLFSLDASKAGEGNFKNITAFAATAKKIGIIDNDRKSFLLYDTNGKFEKEISNQEGKTPVWGDLTDITSDPEGRFYILDSEMARVRIFDEQGKYISDFATQGSRLVSGPQHQLLVLDKKIAREYFIYPVSEEISNLKIKELNGDLELKWDMNPAAQSYRIYRGTEKGLYKRIAETTKLGFVDSETIPGTEYIYAVRGTNSIGYEGNWTFLDPIRGPRKKNISLVSIGEIGFDSIFSAAYKYYSSESIGTVEIKNNDSKAYRNVKISVGLKNYTDFPTEKIIPILNEGETYKEPITMTLNDKILEITEETPVQVDVQVTYHENNEEKKVSKNVPVMIHSRNAISWKDRARIASFVTPKDPPILEFSRMGIKEFLKELKTATIGKPLAKAALFYEAMNGLDISYVQDPLTPYSAVSADPEILDFVQFPRETLRRKTGDCDDTSALLAALLESIGVETAFVDVPGHILVMVNLEESDPNVIGFEEENFVNYRGTLWVPVETTKLGTPFPEAWQAGITAVNEGKEKGELRFIPFAEAREIYTPVTLVEKDPAQPAFPLKKVKKGFGDVLDQLQKKRYQNKIDYAQNQIRKYPGDDMLKIQLGMVHVEGGQPEKGKAIFNGLLKNESIEVQSAAQNNLGNIAFLAGDYKAAAKAYMDASILSPDDGGISINRARVAWKMNDKQGAQKYLKGASEKLSDWREYVKDFPVDIVPKN